MAFVANTKTCQPLIREYVLHELTSCRLMTSMLSLSKVSSRRDHTCIYERDTCTEVALLLQDRRGGSARVVSSADTGIKNFAALVFLPKGSPLKLG